MFPTGQSYLWPVFLLHGFRCAFRHRACCLRARCHSTRCLRARFLFARHSCCRRACCHAFAAGRVFSSLSAAFAITLSFFRGRGFTVYKRKLRDEQSNDCKNHTTQGQRNQTLVQNNPRSNCRNYGHQIDIHARHY